MPEFSARPAEMIQCAEQLQKLQVILRTFVAEIGFINSSLQELSGIEEDLVRLLKCQHQLKAHSEIIGRMQQTLYNIAQAYRMAEQKAAMIGEDSLAVAPSDQKKNELSEILQTAVAMPVWNTTLEAELLDKYQVGREQMLDTELTRLFRR